MADRIAEAVVGVILDANQYLADIKGFKTKVSADLKEVGQRHRELEQNWRTLSRTSKIAFAAISGAITGAVVAASKFESQMANVSTMLQGRDMRFLTAYKDALGDMSVQFGEGTDTLSKGLYDILSAAIPASEALSVLDVSAKAAKAGLTDTGVAADAITTILNSYGMEAWRAKEVSDSLFETVLLGKTTFGQLAPQIGLIASTAASAGVSLDELSAAIATATRNTGRTDVSITGLNMAISAFMKPTNEAIEASQKFGFEMNTNTLRSIGLRGVLEKLRNATQEELGAIFGNVRAIRVINPLINDYTGFVSDLEKMYKKAGATQGAYEKNTATLEHQFNMLKQALILVLVEIGTMFTDVAEGVGVVEKITNAIAGMAKSIRELDPETKKWITAFGLAAVAVTGLAAVLIPLGIAITALAAGPVGTLVLALIGAGGLVAATVAVTSALGEMGNPVAYIGTEFDRMTRKINDTTKEFAQSQVSLMGLVAEYKTLTEELNSGTLSVDERTKKEAALRDVIGQIAKQVPGATTAVDEYGRAISINISAVEGFIGAQQRMFVLTMKQIKAEAELTKIKLRDKYAEAKEELDKLLPLQEKALVQYNRLAGADPFSDAGREAVILKNRLDDLTERVLKLQITTGAMEGATESARIADVAIAEAMAGVQSAAEGDTEALNGLAHAHTEAAGAAEKHGEAEVQAATYVKGQWSDVFEQMSRDQHRSTQVILASINAEIQKLKEAGVTTGDELKELMDLQEQYTKRFAQRFTEIWGNVFDTFKGGLSEILQAGMSDWSSFGDAVESVMDSMANSFKKAIADSIVEKMGFDDFLQGNLLEDIPGMFSAMGATVTSGFGNVFGFLESGFNSIFGIGAAGISTGVAAANTTAALSTATAAAGTFGYSLPGPAQAAFEQAAGWLGVSADATSAAAESAAAAAESAAGAAESAASTTGAVGTATTSGGVTLGTLVGPLALAAAGWLNAAPDAIANFKTLFDSSANLVDRFDGLASNIGYLTSPATSFTSNIAGMVGLDTDTADALETIATWGAAGMAIGGPVGGTLGAIGGAVYGFANSLGIGGRHVSWEEEWNKLVEKMQDGVLSTDEAFNQLYLRATNYASNYYNTQDSLLDQSMEKRQAFYDTYANMGIFTEDQLQQLRDALQLYDTAEERAEAAARTQKELMLQSYNDKLWKQLKDSPLLHDEVWATDWINTFYSAYDKALETGQSFRDTFAGMLAELPGLSQDAIDKMMAAFDNMEDDVGEVALTVVQTWRDMREEIGASIATAGGNLDQTVKTINSLAEKFSSGQDWNFDLGDEIRKLPGMTEELAQILIDAIKKAKEAGETFFITADDMSFMSEGYNNPSQYPSTQSNTGWFGLMNRNSQKETEDVTTAMIDQLWSMTDSMDILNQRQSVAALRSNEFATAIMKLTGATSRQQLSAEDLTDNQLKLIEATHNLDWLEVIAPFPDWSMFIDPVNLAQFVYTEEDTKGTEPIRSSTPVINQTITIGEIRAEADVNEIKTAVMDAIQRGTRTALKAAYV